MITRIVIGGLPLKKKFSGWCPCGYYVEGCSSKKEAILQLQLHVEKFHKDILPFGLTNEEALVLLKIKHVKSKEESKVFTVKSTEIVVQ